MIDKKAYETIGYQAGKFEVLTHFNGQHLEGASALYTVKEWWSKLSPSCTDCNNQLLIDSWKVLLYNWKE